MNLGQPQEEIPKASLPVSADLNNNIKSILLETNQKNMRIKKIKPFMSLILEEQQKSLQSFINNATYLPMNPDADDVTYKVSK